MPKCGVVIKPKLHRLYHGNSADSMCNRLGNSLWVCVLISPPPNGTKVVWKMSSTTIVCQKNTYGSKVGRLLICQIWKFEWNRRGTESKKREKWGKRKIINAQMSVLTKQVQLKIQFRYRFDQNCPFTDYSLHRLGSRFARTMSVPLKIKFVKRVLFGDWKSQKLKFYWVVRSCRWFIAYSWGCNFPSKASKSNSLRSQTCAAHAASKIQLCVITCMFTF